MLQLTRGSKIEIQTFSLMRTDILKFEFIQKFSVNLPICLFGITTHSKFTKEIVALEYQLS